MGGAAGSPLTATASPRVSAKLRRATSWRIWPWIRTTSPAFVPRFGSHGKTPGRLDPELTTEVWEGINETYLELEALSYAKMVDQGFREFFDWVKERSHLFRGAIYGTMRRGDAFTFSRLGTFIERADNTARFLAIKWDMLSPGRPIAAADYYRWGALLRAFSALKAYREVYSGIIEPRRVAELLILRRDMPRSLFCLYRGSARHSDRPAG